LPRDFHSRLRRLAPDLAQLRIYVLGVPDQVAMKVVALREQDLEDLDLLLPQLSKADRSVLLAIMDHVGKIRPDWAQRIHYFLLEQGWPID
jgi:hypothetical protein